MYQLGDGVGALANLAFGLIGVWMAHSLYKTTRRRWQAVLAWVLIFLVWTFGAALLEPVLFWVPKVRVSMLVGFTGIFVYLYLFQDIPIQQRIFTYFMVDTSMALLVLFSRTVSMLLRNVLPIPSDWTFLALYTLVTAGFMFLFHRRLKGAILKTLPMFRTHLGGLAAFAAICYVSILLLVDPWDAWPRQDVWSALGWFGLIAFAVSGYLLAFRTLSAIRAQSQAEEHALRLAEQTALSERYYGSLVEQIEQTRIHNHDLRHHVNALSVLCDEAQWDAVGSYVTALSVDLPRGLPHRYCAVAELNAMLDYYAYKCEQEALRFTCHVELPADTGINPLHLCVIFGNALENALEASRTVAAHERLIDVSAALSEHRVVISVANRFGGMLSVDESGQPRSTKPEPGHGLGLASIRETAQQYGGWCGTHAAEGMFTLQVLLKCRT